MGVRQSSGGGSGLVDGQLVPMLGRWGGCGMCVRRRSGLSPHVACSCVACVRVWYRGGMPLTP